MSRRPGEGEAPPRRPATARRIALLLTLLPVALPLPLSAQPPATGIELTRRTRQIVQRLQESWLQWMSSFYQGDREAATRNVQDLRAVLEHVGLPRLPDLALGATARAIEAARQGNFDRALWALESAESMDPGRPETAFARAVLAWEQGERLTAAGSQLAGYGRLLRLQPFRYLAWSNLLLGLLAAVLVAAAAFVLLLVAVKGPELYRALHASLRPRIGSAGAHVLTVALLLWPAAIPPAAPWLLLYWSLLVWGRAGGSQRVVLVAVWAVAGAAPVLVALQQPRVAVRIAPEGRVLAALAEGRLYGRLFSDLGQLRDALPDEPAVVQVVADVHRKLGQWELARQLYAGVLEVEPENAAALVDMGAYFYRKGDYGNAVTFFQQAAAVDPENPLPYYNLSQAYSASLLFDEQNQALSQARGLDNERVTRWIREAAEERVLAVDGGIARRAEILGALRERTGGAQPPWLSLVLPLLAVAAAVVLGRLLPRRVPSTVSEPPLLARLMVPGLPSVVEDRGVRAFAALAAVSLLVVLLLGENLGYPLPLGLAPGDALPRALAAAGLVAVLVPRLVAEVRG